MTFRPFAASLTLLTIISISANSFAVSAPATPKPAETSAQNVYLEPRVLPAKPFSTAISPSAVGSYVVVKFKDNTKTRLRGQSLQSGTSHSLKASQAVLDPYLNSGKVTRLMASVDESRLDKDREALQYRVRRELADMNCYYRIAINSPAEAAQLINQLNQLDEIEVAYFEPAPEPAGFFDITTSDWSSFQDYREAAPGGVDADYANTQPGGDGSGITITDIEGAWRDTHEDLGAAAGGLVGGTMIADIDWRNHGTAVLGEMIASDNGFGVKGIAYNAKATMASIGTLSLAEAFYAAFDTLQQGDLVLIELHAPGPHYNFQSRPDQLGYICMEYWQDNFDVIQYAWAKGIVVIEAAGNGAENFNDAGLYGQLFDTTYRNSHAIIAGAGYPAASASNLQRQSFSNYGTRVNLQGYGSGVYSTGYGNLEGSNEDNYYTSSFSGTSSASPIITGSVACLQGHYKATYGTVMTSDQIRKLLNSTGTAQLGDITKHIGPRPNLFAAFAAMQAPASIYATPIMIDTSLFVGTTGNTSVWLHNRSATFSFDFDINGNDSLAKSADWLQTSPSTGTVSPLDSVEVTVMLDATVLDDASAPYKGILEVNWGLSGGPTDSLSLVPVYLTVPCGDSSYEVLSSNDVGGPTYNWISAKTLGFKIQNSNLYSLGLDPKDDGTTGPWGIKFPFPFYTDFVDSVYIGVNGGLSFTDTLVDPTGYFEALSLPGSPLSTFVAPFWNDLIFDNSAVPQASLYIYWNAKKDTTVIEWYRPSNFNAASDTLTNFEIVLTKDGNIVFQYLNVGNSGLDNTALAGISQVDCKALSYFDNSDVPTHKPANGMAIRFKNLLGEYRRTGNANADAMLNVVDLNYLVAYFFLGGSPPPIVGDCDVNCDGAFNVVDLNYLVAYFFLSGTEPCSYFSFY